MSSLSIGVRFAFLAIASAGLGPVVVTGREEAKAVAQQAGWVIKVGQGQGILHGRHWTGCEVRVKAVAALATVEPLLGSHVRNGPVAVEASGDVLLLGLCDLGLTLLRVGSGTAGAHD